MTACYRLLNSRGIHYLVTRFGPIWLRKVAFDARHAGPWMARRDKRRGELASVVEKYAQGGNILDLGCGTGGLVELLAPDTYASFTGIDLSEVAVAAANAREHPKARFLETDMCTFRPDRNYSLVIFEECLYYMRCGTCRSVIDKYIGCVDPGGTLVVTTTDSRRYEALLDMIRATYTVVEDRFIGGSGRHLFVLRNHLVPRTA